MGLAVASMLAQAAPDAGLGIGQYLIRVGMLIVAVVLGTIGLLLLRKRMMAHRSSDDAGFTAMEEMRAMVDRGEMTSEEFEQVRKSLAAKIRSASTDAPTTGPKPGLEDRSDRTGSNSNR